MTPVASAPGLAESVLPEEDRRPFTGPLGRPIDLDCRRQLARLTPLQEAVLRLRQRIGTARVVPFARLAARLLSSVAEIRRVEREALALLEPGTCPRRTRSRRLPRD